MLMCTLMLPLGVPGELPLPIWVVDGDTNSYFRLKFYFSEHKATWFVMNKDVFCS